MRCITIFTEFIICFLCYLHIKDCKEGWYGDNCTKQCLGHCIDGVACNHVTGQCDTGCDAGWTGTMCENGNFALLLFYFYKKMLSYFMQEHYI